MSVCWEDNDRSVPSLHIYERSTKNGFSMEENKRAVCGASLLPATIPGARALPQGNPPAPDPPSRVLGHEQHPPAREGMLRSLPRRIGCRPDEGMPRAQLSSRSHPGQGLLTESQNHEGWKRAPRSPTESQNHRITESRRLEETSKIIQPNRHLNTPMPAKPCPQVPQPHGV